MLQYIVALAREETIQKITTERVDALESTQIKFLRLVTGFCITYPKEIQGIKYQPGVATPRRPSVHTPSSLAFSARPNPEIGHFLPSLPNALTFVPSYTPQTRSEATPTATTPPSPPSLVPPATNLVPARMVRIPLLPLAFLALFPFALGLPLQSLLLELLRSLLHPRLRLLQIGRESRVCASLTRRTIGAEASQVERAQGGLLVVLQRAVRAERAETPIVVRTRRSLRLGIDVEIQTVVAVGAGLRAGVVGALGHATQVVLVEELARFALLAEAAQPVLAYKTVTLSAGETKPHRAYILIVG